MDSSEITVRGESSCDRVRPVRNDDMAEGDYYAVKSDSWDGKPHITKRPSECTMTFNLGDRMVSLQVNVWWCLQPYPEPFLEVYSDCEGNRNGFLVRTSKEIIFLLRQDNKKAVFQQALFNCSSTVPTISVDSPSYCITLYHYREHIKSGYFFSVSVVAMQGLSQSFLRWFLISIQKYLSRRIILLPCRKHCSGYNKRSGTDNDHRESGLRGDGARSSVVRCLLPGR